MVSVEDAFTDAWRSYRIQQGDDIATIPDPLGRKKQRKAKKKQKTDPPIDSGGGFFVDDEEESGGGGFLPEKGNEGNSREEEDDDDIEGKKVAEFIPLSSVPDALATLSLPTNDEFVLDLFAQTATYINNDSRRRKPAAEVTEKMVSLHDFKRVAEVLLDEEDADRGEENEEKAEEARDEEDEDEEEAEVSESQTRRKRPVRAAASTANKKRRKQIQDEKVEAVSEDDDVSSIDFAGEEEDYEEEANTRHTRRAIRLTHKNKKKAAVPSKSAAGGLRRSRKQSNKTDVTTTETDEEGEEDDGHLTASQRRTVHAAFHLFTSKLQQLKRAPLDDPPRLSKDDLKLLVAHIGEKIPEKEIDEMIDEGMRFFAKASSRDVTRQTARLKKGAAAGRATARGEVNRSQTVGIDEFGGILLQGRLI